MLSERKIQANRRNARLSTGPRTPEGKAIASRNALKHGLSSRAVLLPEDNPEEFQGLLEDYRSQFQPASPYEESRVFQLAAADWCLRRAACLEARLFSARLDDLRHDSRLQAPQPHSGGLPDCERSRQDSLALALALCWNRGANSFLQLLRHENRIRHAFYRARRELELVRAHAAEAPATQKFSKRTHHDPAAPAPVGPGPQPASTGNGD